MGARVKNKEESAPGGARPRSSRRSEKSEAIREALLKAAAEVVGEVGYANASIALITQKAGTGQGTFYNYFTSRQEILDALLPALGRTMRNYIKDKALGGHDFGALEERSFRAFFDFLQETPKFFRILDEAYYFAPEGYARHFDSVSSQYRRFLKHSLDNGEFPGFNEADLETLVFILMSARSYLAQHYSLDEQGNARPVPEHVIQTYMKFVRYGLQGVKAEAAGASKKSVRSSKTGKA